MNVLHIKYGPFDKVETSIEHKILKECVVYVEMMLMRIRKEIVFPSTSIAWVFSHDIWGIHQIVTHKHTHTPPPLQCRRIPVRNSNSWITIYLFPHSPLHVVLFHPVSSVNDTIRYGYGTWKWHLSRNKLISSFNQTFSSPFRFSFRFLFHPFDLIHVAGNLNRYFSQNRNQRR